MPFSFSSDVSAKNIYSAKAFAGAPSTRPGNPPKQANSQNIFDERLFRPTVDGRQGGFGFPPLNAGFQPIEFLGISWRRRRVCGRRLLRASRPRRVLCGREALARRLTKKTGKKSVLKVQSNGAARGGI